MALGGVDTAWVNAVGVGAALCSMTSFAPQIIKLVKTRDASGVSLRTYAVTVTGFVLWTLYGVLLGSWPVTVSNIVCLGMSAAVLALKWRYGGDSRRARPRS
jgi:MtN3 and saliva related transmembrane protein